MPADKCTDMQPKQEEENVAPSIPIAAVVKAVVLCCAYIAVSSVLIRFNKFLMHEDRFPFSMALTSMHMLVSFCLCLVFYMLRPSSFPGMANTEGKKLLVLTWFVPIGITFAIALYASNQAYLYCAVTFLQFMKEGNMIIAFLLSCAVGLQVLSRVRAAIILWIMAGSLMAVSGEIKFVFVGFAFQLVSQLAECSRAVMGEFVLSGAGLKLDPLSYTMFVAPTCLLVLIVGTAVTWDPRIPAAFLAWRSYILPNALLAFVLNVLMAATIKEVSAMGFILAGGCKDIVIVLFSWMFFGEQVTGQQCLGFTVALTGVFYWSYLKANPSSDTARFAERLLGMPATPPQPTENTPLVKEKV